MFIHRIYLALLILTFIFTFGILSIASHSNIEFKSRFHLAAFIFFFFTTCILLLSEKLKSQLKTNLFLIFCLFLFCTIIYLFQWGGGWKTQTILYRNINESNRSIELQIADQGIFGYSERTVEIKRYDFFFVFIKDISEDTIDSIEWNRVDIYLNEAGLKGG